MSSGAAVHERLSREPDPLIQEHFGAPHIAEDIGDLADHLQAHRAQVVMLVECEIISAADGVALLGALDQLERDPDSIPLRPELNDLVSCTEAAIIDRLGEEIGGKLHTGRSRNDLSLAFSRLATRGALLDLAGDALALRATLVARADETAEMLFPGYTHHTQQAQPITFGHFLLGFQDALTRDVERLLEAYARVNRSTLGGAALAGTGFPVDRDRLAELLGFDGLVEHTADAAGARDFQLEAATAALITLANVDRLAEALIVFTSSEFGYVELDDSLASVSSIMPQKKNPVSLEMVEAMLGRVSGALMTMTTHLKSSTLGVSREVVYADGELARALADARLGVRLMTRVVETLQVDCERAEAAVRAGLSTTTDLADALVRDHGMSFRQAHRVVGRVVAEISAQGSADDITGDLLDRVAGDVVGSRPGLSDAEVRRACDPLESVRSRTTVGGPAPGEVRRMVADRKGRLAADRAAVDSRREALEAGEERLRTAVAAITEGHDA